MISNLKTLRESVIFLVIGSRKLSFVRFVNGKVFSTKYYDITPNSAQDEIKAHLRDYFLGKEGIPVCLLFDIPNQSFTEYRFLKSIGASAIQQSITKKISNDIPQEAIHDYIKISATDTTKKTENVFQVTSLIKTPIVSICIELLHKFPNPIAGYFSMIIEMPAVCDGFTSVVRLHKPSPVVEQDALDVRERHEDDINIAIQYSDSAIINFVLYQGKRILFHHSIICSEITKDIQKEINSTVLTILDYCKQLNKDYYMYVYGTQSFLRSVLETSVNPKCVYFIQSDSPNPKIMYHKNYITQSFAENNSIHVSAYKCLHDAAHFVENKEFFITHLKYKMVKLGSFISLIVLCGIMIYEIFSAYPAIIDFFGNQGSPPSINITTVTHNITAIESTMARQKYLVMLYTNLANDGYTQFRNKLDPIIKNNIFLTRLLYSCASDCNAGNAVMHVNIDARSSDTSEYYSFVSDVQRAFYNYNVTKQSMTDNNSDGVKFTLDISTQTTNTQTR